MVERNIDRIIKYKHFHLIMAIIFLFLAYIDYVDGALTFWFYPNLVLGIINIPAYIIRLRLINKNPKIN